MDKWKKVQNITHKRFSEVIYLLDGSKIFKINEKKKKAMEESIYNLNHLHISLDVGKGSISLQSRVLPAVGLPPDYEIEF